MDMRSLHVPFRQSSRLIRRSLRSSETPQGLLSFYAVIAQHLQQIWMPAAMFGGVRCQGL